MADSTPDTPAAFASLRRIVGSLAGLVQTRIELFATELQEQKLRQIDHLTWFAAALALCLVGTLLAVGTLALLLWRVAGYAGLFGLAAATLGSGIALLIWVRRRIAHGPMPFAATAGEFRKDAEWARPAD